MRVTPRTAAVSVPALLAALGLVCPGPVSAQQSDTGVKLLPPEKAEEAPKADPKCPQGKAKQEKKDDKKDEKKPANPWAKIPPVRVFPRLGFFPIPPKGPGYYSLRDVVQDNWRDGPPKAPYGSLATIPFSFFDADFRYLEDPKNKQHDLFDPLHRCHLGDCWLLNTGGQFWWRHMNEVNRQLSGRDNTYELIRTRVYGDLWYRDDFRLYAEFLDAHSFNQDLPPLPTDINLSDMLNLFVDVKLFDVKDKGAYLRVGRQEMLLGSERLISPLDWVPTRRTFQGVRAFRQGEKFDLDLFWVQPVVPDPSNFDSVDNDRNFAGAWATYRPEKGHFFDLYYLFLDDTSPPPLLGQPRGVPYNVHTLGSRYVGDKKGWLWDVEAMLQLGERGGQAIAAGSVSVGGGRHFEDLPLSPTFWVYYDYATGDQNPGVGNTYGTFNQLFAFGHYYMGWIDLVARQNIQDFNLHLYLWPTKWIMVWLQYHNFQLASTKDALYNAAGVPIRRDPTGRAGRDVGNEVDVVINFHLGPHSDILTGYSQLFAGDFIRNTATAPGSGRSAELFYLMYSFRW
jgi:hypothetical protein